ncbi:hypothetical protein AS026_29260 [Rhizobium altiplani]|uniref:Uncharacterized protein n=1 Tax=Rhizobium altiplani TaxID=1864509 RepID=A0A125QA25_9HYPH|nr:MULTISPECIES: hypothetical protein [Rhizobium]KWV59192.1 hypothetical protein AS026_29260 [Rhizobium altiplani]
MADSDKPAGNLEAALPGLVDKIKELHGTLDPEEKAVLEEILQSAASHAESLDAHDEGAPDMKFAKSMSVHSSADMRKAYVDLAKDLSGEKNE